MSRNIILLPNSVSLPFPPVRASVRPSCRPASAPRCSMIVPAENLVSGPVGPTEVYTEVSGRQEQGRNNPQDGFGLNSIRASHCSSSRSYSQVKHYIRIVEPKRGPRQSELAPRRTL